MSGVLPTGEALSVANSARLAVKAAVLELMPIELGDGKPTLGPGNRLIGLIAETGGGRTQIRTAAGTLTVAATALPVGAGFDKGMPVHILLRLEGGNVIAQLQPATAMPPLAPPSPSTASTTGPASPPSSPSSSPSPSGVGATTTPPPGVVTAPPLPLSNATVSALVSAIAELSVSASPVATANTPGANEDRPGKGSMALSPSDRLDADASGKAPSREATAPIPSTEGESSAQAAPRLRDRTGLPPSPSSLADLLSTDIGDGLPWEPEGAASAATTIGDGAATGMQRPSPGPRLALDPATVLDLMQAIAEANDHAPAQEEPPPLHVTQAQAPIAATPQATNEPTLEALTAAIATLHDAHPALAHTLLANGMPQPNGRLAEVLYAFVATLGRRDAGAWLGRDLAGKLSRDAPDVLEGLTAFTAPPAERPTAPTLAGWQQAQIPLLTPEGVLPVRLFVKEDGEDDDNPDTSRKGGSRFVLELTFSRLQKVQLDTLVHDRHRLDVTVRSPVSLPAVVQANVREGFSAMMERAGATGRLNFQATIEELIAAP